MIADHPTLNGVNSFNGGSYSGRSAGFNITTGSTIVANWSDGRPLVVAKEMNGVRRVDLGFVLPSGDSFSRGWLTSTDGDLLMANSLLYVMGEI